MEGAILIEPNLLYNLLQEHHQHINLSDPNFMLLLDTRERDEFDESHIDTAIFAPRDKHNKFLLPFFAELECKTHIIVYDGFTSNFKSLHTNALRCATKLWEMGSRNPVKILRNGYEKFSARYPFLRTQKIMYTQRELDCLVPYPFEILPGKLYLGTEKQAIMKQVKKDLKLRAFVDCSSFGSLEKSIIEMGRPNQEIVYHAVNIEDDPSENIMEHFKGIASFISRNIVANRPILVFSSLGLSRAPTAILAYLIQQGGNSMNFSSTFEFLRKCSSRIQPNSGFIAQLQQWSMLFQDKQLKQGVSDDIVEKE